ncbi:MAG: histidinol-phosphate transaminase [Deltaproteobacteria bacterium]|nr:histidinol-phosphate transaminase [Deltaproteobacteria bacterium]
MNFSVDERIEKIPFYPKAKAYGYEEGFIRLSANENPYSPSPRVVAAIMDSLLFLNRYPDGEMELKELIAEKIGLKKENVVLGCGSNEIIELVLKISKEEKRNKVIVPDPTFAFYSIAAKVYGYEVVSVPLRRFHIDLEGIKNEIDERTRLIFISNPNNPTGTIVKRKEFESFLGALPPEVLLVVDEAYFEFVESKDFPLSYRYIKDVPIVCLRTFSKAYGLAGLRVGFGLTDERIASFLERVRQPFSINVIAFVAAKVALGDSDYVKKMITTILKEKRSLYENLEKIGLDYVPSESNFVLVKLGKKAEEVADKLFLEKIVVRWMGPLGLPEYIRVTVGKREENVRFIHTLKRIIKKE